MASKKNKSQAPETTVYKDEEEKAYRESLANKSEEVVEETEESEEGEDE